MKTYVYITLGQTHAHKLPDGRNVNKNTIVKIPCDDATHGREAAFAMFGSKWHNCYSADEFDPDILCYFPDGIVQVREEDVSEMGGAP